MSEMSGHPRNALVTGGTAGIGRAIALALLRDGFRVAVLGRRAGPLADMERLGCLAVAADVGDSVAVDRARDVLETAFGALDALVNAAGVIAREPLGEATADAMQAQIAVNLVGTIWSCRSFLPMLQRARGAIVNFSSALAHRPIIGTSVYAAAKGGVEAFTRALAYEAGPAGVRVNAIAPSLVRTDIWTSAGMSPDAYNGMLRARGREYPLGRAGTPEDVAELAAFLVSSRAAWMTGAIVPLDGGSRLGLHIER
ncbi:MAG: SDR family oxidoreductase [Xanthobacteraceae bacterium]|nr:SDR family oxidoreductase [Xanthobacteraceae bacterium]